MQAGGPTAVGPPLNSTMKFNIPQIAAAVLSPVLLAVCGYNLHYATAPIRQLQIDDAIKAGIIPHPSTNMAGDGLTTNYLKP